MLNCGSSSVKYKVFDMPGEKILAQGAIEKIGGEKSLLSHAAGNDRYTEELPVPGHGEALALITRSLLDPERGVISSVGEVRGIGHRVVHGGEGFDRSVVIDRGVLERIRSCRELAPLHNPHNLAGIEAAVRMFPDSPQVAVFDTAFHRTIPPAAYLYALPYRLYREHHIRRYGFHGTSHHYVSRRAAEMTGRDGHDLNAVTCHLGNGCSVTAVRAGRSVDTSMGLTPLEGLVMGTRCGDIDPGIIFHLAEKFGMGVKEINALLNRESGLLGISGVSNDSRELEEAARAGDEMASLALEVFCYRIRKYIGAYFFVLGRVDAVVFTGGIGENSSLTREKALENTAGFGIRLDRGKNERTIVKKGSPGGEVTEPGSPVKVLVIPTDEENLIAHDTWEAVAG